MATVPESIVDQLPAKAPGAGIELVGAPTHPYAMIFRRERNCGARFLTPSQLELQVGVLEWPSGHQVHAHTHPCHSRTQTSISEFLYIESGRVAVQIFDEDWKLITESEIGRGEMLLLLRGGHALRVLETVRMIEVRQGPYLAESDKRYGDVD